MVFRAVVFTFMPTMVELVLVCTLLSTTFSPVLVLIVLATFAIYVVWTVYFTSRAAQVGHTTLPTTTKLSTSHSSTELRELGRDARFTPPFVHCPCRRRRRRSGSHRAVFASCWMRVRMEYEEYEEYGE
jgi:hypothetical protein